MDLTPQISSLQEDQTSSVFTVDINFNFFEKKQNKKQKQKQNKLRVIQQPRKQKG